MLAHGVVGDGEYGFYYLADDGEVLAQLVVDADEVAQLVVVGADVLVEELLFTGYMAA